MKFIGLISGGKDSIFNIMKCIDEGHELVAVGNMFNADEGLERDSYMYQTVGTNVTSAIAEALGVPLFRREIKGQPKLITLQYDATNIQTQGDEVQDLFELIKEAKLAHPEIEGVSSGAIGSTYQKLRVENICDRLGLRSLAYLWQRDQEQLLKEMIARGMNVILIKVASYGLSEKHLNRTITDLQPYFCQLVKECGMNVCGEGGQYESLTLDCPIYRKSIKILDYSVVKHCPNEYAPVVYMRINQVELVNK